MDTDKTLYNVSFTVIKSDLEDTHFSSSTMSPPGKLAVKVGANCDGFLGL